MHVKIQIDVCFRGHGVSCDSCNDILVQRLDITAMDLRKSTCMFTGGELRIDVISSLSPLRLLSSTQSAPLLPRQRRHLRLSYFSYAVAALIKLVADHLFGHGRAKVESFEVEGLRIWRNGEGITW